MSGVRRTARALVVTMVAAAALCGCSAAATISEEPPTAAPSPTVASTPLPSPTPTAPVAPQPPTGPPAPTRESAEATASYMMLLYPYVYWSGDTGQWDQMSGPDCLFCNQTRDEVRRVATSSHTVEGGDITVLKANGHEITPGSFFSVLVQFDEAPSVELDTRGVTVASSDGGSYTALFAMRWVADRWVVEQVDTARLQ